MPLKFITLDDIRMSQKDNVLNAVSENDLNNIINAENYALSYIKALIGHMYDMDLVYHQTGDDRNYLIVQIVVDIVLFKLACRTTPTLIPQQRQANYDKSTDMLNKISAKKSAPNLPHLDLTREPSSEIYLGSDYKINRRY